MVEHHQLTPVAEATAGAFGSVVANVIIYPLDVIKTRLQVQNKALSHLKDGHFYKTPYEAFLQIFKSEGISGLYAGIRAGLFGTLISSFSYFYFYTHVRGYYIREFGKGRPLSTAMELFLGAFAGALSQFVTLPIAVVTTRMQTAPKDEKESLRDTIKTIIREEGVIGLWKGLQASLILCINPAITYGMFERIKSIYTHGSTKRLTPIQTFFLGAISKSIATVVTYPYIMAKVRMQWKPPKDFCNLSEKERAALTYKSSFDVLVKVFQDEGFRGFYHGLQTQITKAVISQAILFTSKDRFELLTYFFFKYIFHKNADLVQSSTS